MPAQKAYSVTTDGLDEGFDRPTQELLKLKKEHRELRNAKKAVKQATESEVLKQDTTIERLLRERNDLELNFSLADSNSNNVRDQLSLKRMQTGLQRKSTTKDTIHALNTESSDLDTLIFEFRKKLHDQRVSMGGAEKTANFHKVVGRKMEVAEGKLHRELGNFNTVLTDNEKYRARLYTMRKARDNFQQNLESLNGKHAENKQQVVNLIQQSTELYNQMEEDRAKTKLQQDKSEKEIQQYVNDITTEERKIDHELRQQNFMNVKGYERDDSERGHREREIARKRANEREKSLAELETAYVKISTISKDSLGISNDSGIEVDKIIETFKENDDINFSLFTFVNKQNNDIEKLMEEVGSSNTEYATQEHRLQKVENSAAHEKQDLEEQEEMLEESKKNADDRLVDDSEHLAKFHSGILALFEKLGCEEADLGIALKTETLDSFLDKYLAVIEAKLNNLLSAKIYLRHQTEDNEDDFTPADAVREVLGAVEKPKSRKPIITHDDLQPIESRSTPAGVDFEKSSDKRNSTVDDDVFKIQDVGLILNYAQLKDRVKSDMADRRASLAARQMNTRKQSVMIVDRQSDSEAEAE